MIMHAEPVEARTFDRLSAQMIGFASLLLGT